MAEKSILNTLEKITGEKFEKTEETPKKRKGNPEFFKKYWADIRAGKRPAPKPWSKKKVEKEKVEKKQKVEMKLEKKPFDEESEEIKKELEKKATNEKILEKKEKPVLKVKEEPEKEKEKEIDYSWLIYGLAGMIVILLIMQGFSKSSASKVAPTEAETGSKTRKFDIGGGRIIEIPVR